MCLFPLLRWRPECYEDVSLDSDWEFVEDSHIGSAFAMGFPKSLATLSQLFMVS